MTSFDPHETTRTVLASTKLSDPIDIAEEVFRLTPRTAVLGAYHSLLREVAREEIRKARAGRSFGPTDFQQATTGVSTPNGGLSPAGSDSTGGGQTRSDTHRSPVAPRRTANKSSRVAAIRSNHEKLLAQRVFARGEWKLLGDCTLQDVRDLAEQRRMVAARNEAVAERFEKLAARMDELGAATVRDLGAEVAA